VTDSILWLATIVLVTLAMASSAVVGWLLHDWHRDREAVAAGRRLIASLDETDQAGA
jgi:hypothetical protein